MNVQYTHFRPNIGLIYLKGALNQASQQDILDLIGQLEEIKLVLDFSAVSFISSAGIDLLLLLHKTLFAKGQEIYLLNLPCTVTRILEHMNVLILFQVINSLEDLKQPEAPPAPAE